MGYRVLIVDDSSTARNILQVMLETLGHQVVAEAASVSSALKAYQSKKPDLVMLDISLPGEDGLVFLRDVHEIDPQARVVVVTGNEQRELRKQILRLHALDVLYKPFDTQKLLGFLDKISPRLARPAA